ncbi:hypothetical protein ACFWUZ_35595 [Streptomyces sp. NPDC058646]|uniref:hypothetical protein n=1 Tax=Streptomyces sp. NPDC058646 TaxID=3346574 RepID=UPI0036674F14
MSSDRPPALADPPIRCHHLTHSHQREGAHRPVPRGHSEEITVDGETQPVIVKLGVWVSNTKTRRDKLAADQLDGLRAIGMEWA